MAVIDFLDSHSGAVTAIATVVLVCITGYYAQQTGRLVKATNTPKIAIYLAYDEMHFNCGYICVENIGTGPAHDVQFKTDLSFNLYDSESSEGETLENVGFIKNGIKYLPPGQKNQSWMSLHGRLEGLEHTPLEVAVTYKDSVGKKNSDCFCIDFSELPGLSYHRSLLFQITEQLEKINESLKSIAGNVR